MNRLVYACVLGLSCLFLSQPAPADEAAVTLGSLLQEMINRDAAARWPRPEYLCKQASSYDRRSKTPSDPKGWFANTDNMDGMGADLKWVTIDGRRECILMDVTGPGAVVRFWTGGNPPKGKIRFYLDGSDKPAIEGSLYGLLGGREFVPKPIAIENSGDATNLYLPIPYAKGCKITYDEVNPRKPNGPPPGRWFNIEYRAYPDGTKVEPFTMERYNAQRELIDTVAKTLANPPAVTEGKLVSLEKEIEQGGQASVDLPSGNAAVRQLTVRLVNLPADEADQAHRSLVLAGSFDDQQTIWCPLGEFFGCGVGIHELRSWTRTVEKDGTLTCRWVMPYGKLGKLSLLNMGTGKVTVKLEARVGDWTWDDRSMYFHGTWRNQYPIATRPFSDWNYITISGKGVYAGDTLAIMSHANKWWGEGDEKIWVDGENFPSHFGTGTEDYYGYAWGNPTIFQGPFCNQPSSTGDLGHRTNTRTRALDAIPFTKSLQFDMEIWHWADTKVAYSVATYWYAFPGATSTLKPDPESAAAPLPQVNAGIRGAIECENMNVLAKSDGLNILPQKGYRFAQGAWNGDGQLLVQAGKTGEFIELLVAEKIDGPRKLTLYGTKSYDYGRVRFTVNGKKVDKDFDGYSPQAVLSGPIELGTFEPQDGKIVLRVETAGTNPATKESKQYFGLDCVVVGKP